MRPLVRKTLLYYHYIKYQTAPTEITITEADEKEAMNKDNIIKERTRDAAKQNYAEPGDEEVRIIFFIRS